MTTMMDGTNHDDEDDSDNFDAIRSKCCARHAILFDDDGDHGENNCGDGNDVDGHIKAVWDMHFSAKMIMMTTYSGSQQLYSGSWRFYSGSSQLCSGLWWITSHGLRTPCSGPETPTQ